MYMFVFNFQRRRNMTLLTFPQVFLILTSWGGLISALQPPQNVRKSLLNLNYELHWTAPSDATNGTLYVVEYQHRRNWYAIPGCTDINRMECLNMTQALIHEFGQNSVRHATLTGFYVRVSRREAPLELNSSAPSVISHVFPYTDATIGPPDIREIEVTSDSLHVGLLAPETPFSDRTTGNYICMDDRNLGGVSKVYYGYTLWKMPGGTTDPSHWIVERTSGPEGMPAKRGLHDYTSLRLAHLRPNTKYVLATRAKLGSDPYSLNKTTLILKTREAAPSQGPVLGPLEVMKTDCNKPDSRDVQVDWKPPPREEWNGDDMQYEVRYSRVESGIEHLTAFTTLLNSTTLRGLSRWDRYDIVVFANTSAGGTASSRVSLPAAVVGMANSKPEDLRVLMNSSTSAQEIAWVPPSEYDQCVLGYRVTVQSDSHDGRKREEIVKNSTSWEVRGLEMGSYTVEVAAIVKTGFNSTSLGVAGNVRLKIGPDWRHIMLYAIIATSCLFLGCFAVFIFLKARTYYKDERFSLKDNKILNRALSHDYSRLPRQVSEKETFDLPGHHEILERQTSSLSRDSEASNQTNSSSGYSTDVKHGAVEDEADNILLDSVEGRGPDNSVDSNQSLMRLSFSDDFDVFEEDIIFDGLQQTPGTEIINHQKSSLQNQSAPEGSTDKSCEDLSDEMTSDYTPVSSYCLARQLSVDDNPPTCQKVAEDSHDSPPTSPYLESYTVLANCTGYPASPHPLASLTGGNADETPCKTNSTSVTVSGKQECERNIGKAAPSLNPDFENLPFSMSS